MARAPDTRVLQVRMGFEDHHYRTPIKFGGRALDRVTLLNVAVEVENKAGKRAEGFGSMPLGNIWSFPTDLLTYDETMEGMKRLARRIGVRLRKELAAEWLDPVEQGHRVEPMAMMEATAVSAELKFPVPIPALCALVTASPFDAALHDAFGKVNGVHVFRTYGAEFIAKDLSHYLDSAFKGEYLDRYVLPEPKRDMPLYHLVGALDPLFVDDVKTPVGDGLPETLEDWIKADGLTHLKIKLNGDNLEWDIERVMAVNRAAENVAMAEGPRQYQFSLDFNEKCKNVEYLLEFLNRVKAGAPRAFGRIQYIEQPTARDLKANPANKMHAANKIKPVVIDESLLGYESLLMALDMGYSGVALKACKGQTQSALMAAAAQKKNMFLCVQDLTCPGASFLHSLSLAAHIGPVAAIEGNGRQYCPGANAGWRDIFPGVFTVKRGRVESAALSGPGLGCVPVGRIPMGLEAV